MKKKTYLIITSMKFTRSGKYMYKPCPQGQILNAEINAQCHKVSHRVTVTSSDLHRTFLLGLLVRGASQFSVQASSKTVFRGPIWPW